MNLGNGYAYGANAPQNYTDPFGLKGCADLKNKVAEAQRKVEKIRNKVRETAREFHKHAKRYRDKIREIDKKWQDIENNGKGKPALPFFNLDSAKGPMDSGRHSVIGHAYNISDRYGGANKHLRQARELERRFKKQNGHLDGAADDLAELTKELKDCLDRLKKAKPKKSRPKIWAVLRNCEIGVIFVLIPLDSYILPPSRVPTRDGGII